MMAIILRINELGGWLERVNEASDSTAEVGLRHAKERDLSFRVILIRGCNAEQFRQQA
jgi:hypothetical protein